MHNAHDDEGLIDLGALSVPPRHGAAATSAVFSFASEPPTEAPARSSLPAIRLSAARRNIGLAAAAVCFVVLSSIGVAFAFRGEQAVTPPVVLTNALVAPRATAAVAAPTPAPASTDPAASVAAAGDDDDSSSDAPKKSKKGRGHKARGAAGMSRSAASTPKPPKSSAPADPCHCHGDFQCNIRCAANFKH